MVKVKPYQIRFAYTLLLVAIVTWVTSSCRVLEAGIEQPATPDNLLEATLAEFQFKNEALGTQIAAYPTTTPTPLPTSLPGSPPTPTLSPTATPAQPTPKFSHLRFTAYPDLGASTSFYTAGTPKVNAVWDYVDMTGEVTIKRVWYYNDKEWYVREEPWNFAKYGAAGAVKDISVFDYDTGLQAGKFSLSLYIDGVLQDVGDGVVPQTISNFWVFPPEVTGPIVSENDAYSAYVKLGGRLVIQSSDGSSREIVSTDEIASLDWFPDNIHILYTDRDRSKQVNEHENWGITNQLWILDVETGEQHLVGTNGENFHDPIISPNGHYIAVLAGDTSTDRCTVSPSLDVIELTADLRRQAIHQIYDFSDLPYINPDQYSIYPRSPSIAGDWQHDNSLIVSLGWSCLNTANNPDGHYLLDILNMTATRIGD